MSGDTKYFLVPASSGLCIQPGQNKTETAPIKGDECQLWQIEQSKKNKIAFRNVDSGEYLRAAGGYKSNAVQAGARQWWTLEASDTPFAFWIKCDEYPNAYLCNSYGNITPNNTIYMWAKEEYWTQTMLWYFFDYESWSKHRKSKLDFKSSSPSSGTQKKDGELEKKLKEAEEKQHALEEKLKAADDKQRELETKEKENAEKERDLAKREEEISGREKELETGEQNLTEKEAQMKGDEGGNSEEEVQKLQGQLTEIKSDLEKTQRENGKLKAKETELSKLRQAYEELKRRQADGNSRVKPASSGSKEGGLAEVGFRNRPLGLRTREPRPSTTKGRLSPIQLQQSFSRLPRLRT